MLGCRPSTTTVNTGVDSSRGNIVYNNTLDNSNIILTFADIISNEESEAATSIENSVLSVEVDGSEGEECATENELPSSKRNKFINKF